jgi:hypothetical protein
MQKYSVNNLDRIQLIKQHIEYRYQRLNSEDRRPSLEYIATEDIRQLFLPFAKDPELFKLLSDQEIQTIYTEWYAKYRPDLWERINLQERGEDESKIDILKTDMSKTSLELSCEGIENLLADLELPDIVFDN